jgi:hypothetical protein
MDDVCPQRRALAVTNGQTVVMADLEQMKADGRK